MIDINKKIAVIVLRNKVIFKNDSTIYEFYYFCNF